MTMTNLNFPFEEVYRLTAEEKNVEAIDLVFDCLIDFHFGNIHVFPDIPQEYHQEVLKEVDLSRLNSTLIVGFLSATLPIKTNPVRIDFAEKAKDRLRELVGEERLPRLLSGLV